MVERTSVKYSIDELHKKATRSPGCTPNFSSERRPAATRLAYSEKETPTMSPVSALHCCRKMSLGRSMDCSSTRSGINALFTFTLPIGMSRGDSPICARHMAFLSHSLQVQPLLDVLDNRESLNKKEVNECEEEEKKQIIWDKYCAGKARGKQAMLFRKGQPDSHNNVKAQAVKLELEESQRSMIIMILRGIRAQETGCHATQRKF
eukprot:6183170-Pleurochrysis_carterae.AAC.1